MTSTVKIKQRQDNVQLAAMVEAMDLSLGRVVAKFEELKLSDNTILIRSSDSGGMSDANLGCEFVSTRCHAAWRPSPCRYPRRRPIASTRRVCVG